MYGRPDTSYIQEPTKLTDLIDTSKVIQRFLPKQVDLCSKLHYKLHWAYQKAQENKKKESECHKRYYDKKMRCMKLKPEDLVMVQVKALTGDHKIADRWEDTPH